MNGQERTQAQIDQEREELAARSDRAFRLSRLQARLVREAELEPGMPPRDRMLAALCAAAALGLNSGIRDLQKLERIFLEMAGGAFSQERYQQSMRRLDLLAVPGLEPKNSDG